MPPTVRCFVVGPLPPPVHGFSVATAAMLEAFRNAKLNVKALDTAVADRGAFSAVAKLWKRVSCSIRLAIGLAPRGKACVYLAVAGGYGQLGDLVCTMVARLFACRIILHHHSFAYLNANRRMTHWLTRAAGPCALHIVLCAGMEELLRRHYPNVGRTMILSNAMLLPAVTTTLQETKPLQTIGFLSNITLDKGIDRFLALSAELRMRGLAVETKIAGPIEDAESERLVKAAENDSGVEYQGSVYGPQKAAFFEQIDVFIFPSRYINEAQPIVVIEALSVGVPIVATRRGCMASLVGETHGLLLDADAQDIGPAVEQISRWASHPAEFALARQAALAHANHLGQEAHLALNRLVAEMAAW